MIERRSRSRRRVLFAAAVAAGVVLALFAASSAAPRAKAAGRAPLVTVFLVDGMGQEAFEEELAAGNLPQMSRLVEEGARVRHGIASFPSMTGYGFYPFITGHDAASSGVLGLRWLDRERGLFRNYVGRTNVHMNADAHEHPATLFERFPDRHTSSFNSYMNRGAARAVTGGLGYSVVKYRDASRIAKLLSMLPGMPSTWIDAEGDIIELAIAELPRRPQVQWIVFTSLDAQAHVTGVNDEYVRVLREIDTLIGTYRAASVAAGQEDERIYALLSDHGVTDVHTNVDLRTVLGHLGLRMWRGDATELWSSELDDGEAAWTGHDGVIAVNGNAMNYLYFRGATGFERPLTAGQLRAFRPRPGTGPVDLLDALVATVGVEHVVARLGPGQILVSSAAGDGIITDSAALGGPDAWSYRVVSGTDPLDYADVPRAGDASGWLEATHDRTFPDAVYRLGKLFRSDDTGDIVVTARDGFDLAADYEMVVGEYRGAHGGLRADQLRVPYVLAGPGIRAGARLLTARAEDIGATLAWLLGAPADGDGRVLSELLEMAPDRADGSAPF